MLSASDRLIRLLTVLSTRAEWGGTELAGRLGVHERTVRRDIAKLRELGYGIDAVPGPWGGYRLGRGSQLPPLTLDDDEALATAVALRRLAWESPDGEGHAALSALVKLQHSLPRRAADGLRRFDSAVAEAGQPPGSPAWGQPDPAVLVALASACRVRDRVRFDYRDRHGTDTVRRVEPARAVRTAHRWYLAAFDLDRDDWRVFRIDRVSEVTVTGRADPRRPQADATALVESAITSTPYAMYADVEFLSPIDQVRQVVPPTVGQHRALGTDRTSTRLGGPDARWLADYLLTLPLAFRVQEPGEVRRLVLVRLEELRKLNGTSGPW